MKKDPASSTTATQSGERARLAALRRYRILDTPEDPELDRIARLAARLLRTPIGLVSLVDENRQWFKSHFGLEIRETARELSFCAHALASDEVMIVRDATKDERFAANALVTGQPDLRFYAGAPLRTKDGFRLGTLSVLDTQARYDLGPDDFTTLEHLAALVMDHLELRLANVLTEDYAAKIGQLPHAAGIIATSDSVEAALQVVADHINSLIGVRRAVAILTDGSTVARAANADDFAGQRCIARADHGLELEIGAIIRNQKRTMQVTRSDLERSYQAGPQASPSPDGNVVCALGAPLVRRDGQSFGAVLALDKNEGTFTAEDEALIKQLAHVASIQIESLLLVQRTRSAEARYRQAESIARLVHWSCHQPVTGSWQLSTLTFSDQAITVLGVSSTELRLTTEEFISRIVHPVDRDRVRHEISESVTARRTHYHLDYRIQRPDGAVAHISEVCHDVYDRSGNWISSFGIMQDVTVHKLLEQALKESSARYRKAERIAKLVHWSIEISLDGQWEDNIVTFSDAAAELLGASDKHLQLTSKDYLQQIVHQDDRGHVRAALDNALANREADISITYRIVRPDGCVRWVVEHVENEYDASGNRTFAFGIIQDVTEQKQRETELKEAYLRANLASRAKSQFLATMSHELRTPLNAIIGFSEVMQREMLGPLGSEGYKEYASDIHNSGTFLLAIINELLDLSLIDAGEMKLDESYVDIDKLAASCLSLLRAKAVSKGIALVQVTQPGGPGLRGDARRIKQAVINIISNAIKFTPSGGTVKISTAWSGQGVTISVKDTGVGIAPADLERVAKPFVQLESWLTREHEGIGLGLPIAKAICELHGGRLMLDSELGIGTVVRMWLPASRTDLTPASASH